MNIIEIHRLVHKRIIVKMTTLNDKYNIFSFILRFKMFLLLSIYVLCILSCIVCFTLNGDIIYNSKNMQCCRKLETSDLGHKLIMNMLTEIVCLL